MKIPNIDALREQNPLLAEALDALGQANDSNALKSGINPQGTTLQPNPPSGLKVTANASGIHRVSIQDNNPRVRALRYWHEWDTNSNFSNAQPSILGPGRQISLPLSMGNTPVYHRVCAENPDGLRSTWVVLGGDQHPTGVVDGATTTGPEPHPTTGSGTSSTPGYGSGLHQFVSPPNQPGRPPKIF